MKQCPACKTTYTDETLSYCLSDGQPLVPVAPIGDHQATVVTRSGEPTAVFGGGEKMRVEIPQATATSNIPRPVYVPAAVASSSGGGLKIFTGVLAVFLLLAVIVIAGGLVFYFSSKDTGVVSKNTATNQSLTPSPVAADDKEDLQKQIANLEKLINEQKKNNQPANVPLTMPKQQTTTTTARVNSPGDGFLALRTLPNSEAGDRILKIPHGAAISIGACGPVVRPVSRTGRWCQASYNGYSGWVFDAYLIY